MFSDEAARSYVQGSMLGAVIGFPILLLSLIFGGCNFAPKAPESIPCHCPKCVQPCEAGK